MSYKLPLAKPLSPEPVLTSPLLSRSVKVSLTRDQLAVAILSYIEHTTGVTIPANDIEFTVVCHGREDGEIDHVEAVFAPKEPVKPVYMGIDLASDYSGY